nr:zinc finger BED domain-containing protein 5-like [Onthophagus taurus]
MGCLHKSLLLQTEVRWLSRGQVLTRLVELRNEVTVYLIGKNQYLESLLNNEFILKLTYLADIFSMLYELNLYLQGSEGYDIFAVHHKIRAFMKKLVLWKRCIEEGKYDCLETFQKCIIESEIQPDINLVSAISIHLMELKNNFDVYFGEEMKKFDTMSWICYPFQDNLQTGLSLKASEELIDLSEDTSLKTTFNRKQLTKFWLSLADTHPCLFDEAMKGLVPFTTSYLCEVGFSAMVHIKTKCRNKLDVTNSLRLKVTKIEIDAKAEMARNDIILTELSHLIFSK